MGSDRRKLLILLIVVGFIAVGVLQSVIDPVQIKMAEAAKGKGGPDRGELMVQLPGQFIVASAAGFREVIAGALWIRADTFFHSGRYHAIIPIVRLVTWLDPHNIDVYITGAWHLDYNFVDQGQMSDKRYIPASIALLEEGIANNPDIWDLYFELGWTHYTKKLMDDDKAIYYLEQACKRPGLDPNTGEKIPRMEFVDHMLAHSYENAGRLGDAMRVWKNCAARISKRIKKTHKQAVILDDPTEMRVVDRNLSLMLLRLGWRYGDMKAYKEGLEIAKGRGGMSPLFDKWAIEGAEKDYARRIAANNPPRDALKPLNTHFEVAWKKAGPKAILIRGKINLVPASEYKDMASECFTHWYQDNVVKANADRRKYWQDGCRVYWRLQDYDYKMPEKNSFDFQIDTSQMVVWDGLYVSGGQFSQLIDLSNPSDASMYPFKAKKYRLTVWWTPEYPTPDFVQDRVGWRGEPIVDKPEYLDTKTRPGFKMLKKEWIIDREQLL